jgi:hypothetical protein
MFRPIRLAGIALSAELLRLRYRARRTATRALMGLFALLLLLGVLFFAHVAAWYWLRQTMPGHFVALIFVGVDLLLALIMGGLASRSSPGMAEVGALAVRDRALEDAAASVSLSALAVRVLELFMATRARR